MDPAITDISSIRQRLKRKQTYSTRYALNATLQCNNIYFSGSIPVQELSLRLINNTLCLCAHRLRGGIETSNMIGLNATSVKSLHAQGVRILSTDLSASELSLLMCEAITQQYSPVSSFNLATDSPEYFDFDTSRARFDLHAIALVQSEKHINLICRGSDSVRMTIETQNLGIVRWLVTEIAHFIRAGITDGPAIIARHYEQMAALLVDTEDSP